MSETLLRRVQETLQTYADRGVFRGFSEVKVGQRKRAFKFVWLTSRQMDFSIDTQREMLRFEHLLPNVPARSRMYAGLKSFVQGRHDSELPQHRRIDRKRAEAVCRNRGGDVSIFLKVKNRQYEYGVTKIVNLVHELFVHLRDAHPDYLSENFDVPQE
jgi:hypothetical protein